MLHTVYGLHKINSIIQKSSAPLDAFDFRFGIASENENENFYKWVYESSNIIW